MPEYTFIGITKSIYASLYYTRVFAVHVLLSTRSHNLALYGHHLDCPSRANLLIQDSVGNTEDQTWRFECLLVLSIMGLGKCVIYQECYKLCGPLSLFLRFGSLMFSVYVCFVQVHKTWICWKHGATIHHSFMLVLCSLTSCECYNVSAIIHSSELWQNCPVIVCMSVVILYGCMCRRP